MLNKGPTSGWLNTTHDRLKCNPQWVPSLARQLVVGARQHERTGQCPAFASCPCCLSAATVFPHTYVSKIYANSRPRAAVANRGHDHYRLEWHDDRQPSTTSGYLVESSGTLNVVNGGILSGLVTTVTAQRYRQGQLRRHCALDTVVSSGGTEIVSAAGERLEWRRFQRRLRSSSISAAQLRRD